MKLLSILFIALFSQTTHPYIGKWEVVPHHSDAQVIEVEKKGRTEVIMEGFYLDLKEDGSFEMFLKGKESTGKWESSSDFKKIRLKTTTKKVINIDVLQSTDQEMQAMLFGNIRVKLHKVKS